MYVDEEPVEQLTVPKRNYFSIRGGKLKIERLLNKLFKRCYRCAKTKDISFCTLKDMLKNSNDLVLIDVRSPMEFREGRINTAINIPFYDIEKDVRRVIPNLNLTIIVYCQSGTRSKKACRILEKLGYTNLYNLIGGLDGV